MIEDYIKLKLTPGLTEKQLFTAFSRRGTLHGIFEESSSNLAHLGFSEKSVQNIRGRKYSQIELRKNLQDMARINKSIPCGLITIEDPRYPQSLHQISSPPVSFFYLGDVSFLHKPSITIVGARKASTDSEQITSKLSHDLSVIGLTIVSGFAYGVDIIAHRSAYKNVGGTVAVLGSGIMDIYPPQHKRYVRDICQNGCIISEFPMGESPSRFNFPQRNRIVSALGLGTIVVEASLKSGSLITAHIAMDQGKPVMAIPSHPADGASGTNKLIKDGAALVENYSDVVDEILPILSSYGKSTKSSVNRMANTIRANTRRRNASVSSVQTPPPPPTAKKPPRNTTQTTSQEYTTIEEGIVGRLKSSPMFSEDILEQLPHSANEIFSAITVLELRDIIAKSTNGEYYLL